MASDEEINELIMRTEEELVMWGQMDLKRLQDAMANNTHHLPRLMQVFPRAHACTHARTHTH